MLIECFQLAEAPERDYMKVYEVICHALRINGISGLDKVCCSSSEL